MDNGEEKYLTLNETSMLEDYDKIRKENGWKPRKPESEVVRTPKAYTKGSSSKKKDSKGSSSDGETVGASPNLTATMTPEQKILARLQAEVQLREQVIAQQAQQQQQQDEESRMQKEAMSLRCFRFIREAEKLEKAETARKEREAKQRELLEQKRKRQEELAKLKQEENLKKMQEKEMKRQQMALAREQVSESGRDNLLAVAYLAVCRDTVRTYVPLETTSRKKDRAKLSLAWY